MTSEKGLKFIDVGAGEVELVFLHYFGGSSNTWSKVIAELSHEYRCIAVDLPGFGDSQGETKQLSVRECAKEVAKVIRSLALKHYILIGHSMGGKIALSLASIQPFGLTSLILIAPSPPTSEPMEDKERKQLLKAYGDRLALETLINNVTDQSLTNCHMENAVTDNFRVSYASWYWWAEQGSREDITSHMSTVRVPVFIISGATDSKFSSSFLYNEMVKYFPLAAFAEIPDAGHLIPIEAPAALAKSIQEFSNEIAKHSAFQIVAV